MSNEVKMNLSEIMEAALTGPSKSGDAYNRVHQYSFLNRQFLMAQGCPPEPVTSFKGWQAIGRQVLKGSRAFAVIRPITVKLDELDDQGQQKTMTRFKPVRGAFPVSMTEGEPLPEYEPPTWSVERALGKLAISRVPFEAIDNATQGYSYDRNVAVSPIAKYPFKTLLHEVHHVTLGHTAAIAAGELEHRGLAEFQAESGAYLTLHELDADDQFDAAASRHYIQTWLRGQRPSDYAIRAVFRSTEEVLAAGREEVAEAAA